jgi:hypothetical protein
VFNTSRQYRAEDTPVILKIRGVREKIRTPIAKTGKGTVLLDEVEKAVPPAPDAPNFPGFPLLWVRPLKEKVIGPSPYLIAFRPLVPAEVPWDARRVS